MMLAILFAGFLTINSKPIELLKPIEQGQFSSIRDTTALIINNQETWELFYSYLHSNRVPPPSTPTVNFKEKFLLFITLGLHRHSGYSVKIDKISFKKDTLKVYVSEICPKKGKTTLQVLTTPYKIIELPQDSLKRFVQLTIRFCNKKEKVVQVKNATSWLEKKGQ